MKNQAGTKETQGLTDGDKNGLREGRINEVKRFKTIRKKTFTQAMVENPQERKREGESERK